MKTTRLIICFGISLFWISDVAAQSKDSLSKPYTQFCSRNELGMLFGVGTVRTPYDDFVWNNENILELSSSNGIRYGRLFAGVGVGIRKWDKHFLLPLFFTLSANLWEGKNSLFLHVDLGHQFGTRAANRFGDKETGSFFVAYGLGYDWSVTENLKLYLKASVCHQSMKASGTYTGLGPSTSVETYNPKYLFFRLSVGVRIH